MTEECTCSDTRATCVGREWICDECGLPMYPDGAPQEQWEVTTPAAVYGHEGYNPYRRS